MTYDPIGFSQYYSLKYKQTCIIQNLEDLSRKNNKTYMACIQSNELNTCLFCDLTRKKYLSPLLYLRILFPNMA